MFLAVHFLVDGIEGFLCETRSIRNGMDRKEALPSLNLDRIQMLQVPTLLDLSDVMTSMPL